MHALHAIDRGEIAALRERGEFLWLDLDTPGDADLRALGELFSFHRLALEDSSEFAQRPKVDDYGSFVLLVAYGIGDDDEPFEVHVYVTGDALVTIHRGDARCLTDAKTRLAQGPAPRSEEWVVYAVLDALTDAWTELLERTDDDIDELERAIVEDGRTGEAAAIVRQRRRLVELRRIAGPASDAIASARPLIQALDGFDADHTRDLLRDVHDHLLRAIDEIDGQRDLLFGVLQLQQNAVANRSNEVSRQLTLVATIFLPLTFVTGFFGQNFGWLTDHVDALWAFLVYGVGGMLASGTALALWFRRERLLDRPDGSLPPHGSGSQPGRPGQHPTR